MKRFAVLLTLLAGTVPVLTGCGAEELAGVDVAKAADATTRKGTARITMTMRMSGVGLPDGIELKAEGVTALAEPKMNLTMDLGALLSMAGAEGDGKLEIRVDGADFYVKPPRIEGVNLPGDGGWIGIDLREIASAMGIDPAAAAAMFKMDPASQLKTMVEAGLEEVGTEEIDGTETTHLKGVISARDALDTLGPEQRKAAEKTFEQLEALSGDSKLLDAESPIELWVDENSIVRRMRTSSKLPAQNGAPGGSFDMTYELSDFGAELDVSKPDDVTDFTDELSGLLKGQLGTTTS